MTITSRAAIAGARAHRRVVRSPAAFRLADACKTAGALLHRLPAPRQLRRAAARVRTRPGLRTVPLDRLLLGDEGGMKAAAYAEATGDLTRPSTPIQNWPHVRLLQEHREHGEELLSPDRLAQTEYLLNARQCLRVTGHYFSATDDEGLLETARRFLEWAAGGPAPVRGPAGSPPGAPVRVRRIRHSDCFQVVDGHHRLALAYVNGDTEAKVAIERVPAWTPVQRVLREMSWLEGRLELYQPLDLPELGADWSLVRRCDDRLAKMRSFLKGRGLDPPLTSSYLDVACCYGWFPARMQEDGYDVHGIERDPKARVIARHAFGLEDWRVRTGDAVAILQRDHRTYDVVSCFSLLHHFVMGRGTSSAETLLRLLDAHTGRVLFVDTGQEHEEWFGSALAGWDADHIERWLAAHTTFREIVRLGADEDGVGRYAGNYGRMLFACVR